MDFLSCALQYQGGEAYTCVSCTPFPIKCFHDQHYMLKLWLSLYMVMHACGT